MADHSPQFENTLSCIREILRSESVKLWLPPFTTLDGSPGGYPEEMITRFATTLCLPPDHVSDALEHLRIHAIEKLQIVERFSKSGIATVKVHFTGNIPVGSKSKIHLQKGLHVSGADFRRRLSEDTGLTLGKMKLICKGHVIEDDKSLESQQVKNNGQIMALVLSETSTEAQFKQNKEEEAVTNVLRTRKAAEALSNRSDDRKDDHYFLEIRDQEGNLLNLPEKERKALALAMTFHEKGRSALKQRNYAEALVLLLEADKEFGHCRAHILDAVDNYGILCLDIVWSYFWLKSIVDLPNAEEKLQKCKECFERSYGKNLERLTSVKGGSGGELALFVRLYVLEAVCAYHRGDGRGTAALLDKAETEKRKLDIDIDTLTQLLLMGFTETEARLGLRTCSGDATSAVDYITRKRQEREQRRKNEKKQRQGEKTASGEWSGSPGNVAQISDEKVAQAISLGFSVESSKEALQRCHGDIQQAIDMLVSCNGVLPPTSSSIEGKGKAKARGKNSEMSGSHKEEQEDPDVREAVKELVPSIGAEDEEAHLNLSLEEESFIILEYRTLLLSSGFQANPGAGL